MLIVTLLGIAVSRLFDYKGAGGAIVGNVPAGLSPLALPFAIPLESHQALWPAALILALVSFTEAMSSCRVLARKQGARWDENQELIGQGMAKVTSGLCGAFPVSGSFSRSALNLYAGATSAWSTLFSALCVLLCLLFLTDFLYYLPQPVLAAMIIVPVFGLLDWRAFRRLFLISRDEGMVAVVTFVVTLCATPQLQWGVFAGVALTMVSYLYRRAHPRLIEVGLHDDGTLRDRQRFGMARLAPDLLAVRLDAALNFLTAAIVERFIVDHLRADPAIRRVLLCAGGINDIDVSGVEALEVLHNTLHEQGVTLHVSALKKQVSDVLERAGVLALLGPERLFATELQALEGLSVIPGQANLGIEKKKLNST
jgi:SulP family sulfate permease